MPDDTQDVRFIPLPTGPGSESPSIEFLSDHHITVPGGAQFAYQGQHFLLAGDLEQPAIFGQLIAEFFLASRIRLVLSVSTMPASSTLIG